MIVATRVSGVSLLFCDLVGSTALSVELGEAANDELRRDLFEVTEWDRHMSADEPYHVTCPAFPPGT